MRVQLEKERPYALVPHAHELAPGEIVEAGVGALLRTNTPGPYEMSLNHARDTLVITRSNGGQLPAYTAFRIDDIETAIAWLKEQS